MGEQRLALDRFVEALRIGGQLGVVVAEHVGVVGGIGVHGEHGSVAGIQGHHRSDLATEGVPGDALEVLAHGEQHVTLGGLRGQERPQLVEFECRGASRQVVVVLALHTVGAEGEGVVPRHVREQLTVGIHTLVAQGGTTLLGGGEHSTIRGDDVAAGLVEVPLQHAGVLGPIVQCLGLEHLYLVQLHEQHRVHDDESDTETPDLPAHGATAGRATRRSARSEIRIKRASRT